MMAKAAIAELHRRGESYTSTRPEPHRGVPQLRDEAGRGANGLGLTASAAEGPPRRSRRRSHCWLNLRTSFQPGSPLWGHSVSLVNKSMTPALVAVCHVHLSLLDTPTHIQRHPLRPEWGNLGLELWSLTPQPCELCGWRRNQGLGWFFFYKLLNRFPNRARFFRPVLAPGGRLRPPHPPSRDRSGRGVPPGRWPEQSRTGRPCPDTRSARPASGRRLRSPG